MDSNLCEKRLLIECIDRISDLPDHILGKILSYLSIKDVFATSILSTRWKTIFPLWVPFIEIDLRIEIEFDDSYIISDSSPLNFLNFVDKLLIVTLRDVPRVEKVAISCEVQYGDDKIVSWVLAALRLNVEQLYLMYEMADSVALFDSLHGCRTLVELELGNAFRLCLPEKFCLPNLKRLSLNCLKLQDDSHKLLDGCPVLDYLRLVTCNLSLVDTLYIQHPILNKLYIDGEGSFHEIGCMIVIDAPNLETFVYEGLFIAKYVLKNTGSLHSVCIDYSYLRRQYHGSDFRLKARRLAKLTKACSSTTRLCFPGNSLKALYSSSLPLPTFQNLTCLTLGRMGSHGWRMLAQFLQSAPNLAILTFEQGVHGTGAHEDIESLLPSLPVCLELHVKKIEIWEYKWRQDESKLIEYFLKNGKVLQELIVHCLPNENTNNLEKLSMLPRHSEACQIILKDKNIQGKSRYSRDNWIQVVSLI